MNCNCNAPCIRNPRKVDVLFIDYITDPSDFENNRPFSGRKGATLRNIFNKAKEKAGKFSANYTYVHTSTESVCGDSIWEEIKETNPKITFLLGEKTLRYFKSGSVRESRRKPFYINEYRFVSLHSPGLGLIQDVAILGEIYNDILLALTESYPEIKMEQSYELITSGREAELATKDICKRKVIVEDIETDDLNRLRKNEVFLIQIYPLRGKTCYCFPWNHPESPFLGKTDKLRPFIEQIHNSVDFAIGHNLKFDHTILSNFENLPIKPILVDTMIGGYLLNENYVKDEEGGAAGQLGSYSMEDQLRLYAAYEDSWFSYAKTLRSRLRLEPLDKVAKYGSMDVINNALLLYYQLEEAKRQGFGHEFLNVLIHFYSPVIKLFSKMETNGIPINKSYLKHLIDPRKSPLLKYIKAVDKLLAKQPKVIKTNSLLTTNSLFEGENWVFDIKKSEHRMKLFFDVMELEPLSFGKPKKGYPDGEPSTDAEFKKHYRNVHTEVELFAQRTRAEQLFGLFPKSFWTHLNTPDGADGRLHPSFLSIGTRTARFSARNPNTMQTVAESDSDKLPSIIRALFEATHGYCLFHLDLKTNEVCRWGDISKDKSIIKSAVHGWKLRKKYFKKPSKKLKERIKFEGDFHYSNCAEFYNIPIMEVTKDQRKSSKTTTFGVMYGLTIPSLAKALKQSKKWVKNFLDNVFFKRFKKGKKWMDKTIEFAKKYLYVESPLGGRRRLWHYLADFPFENGHKNYEDRIIEMIHAKGDRRAMNTPIQRFASELAAIGTFLLQKYIEENNKDWKIENIVHDSIEGENPPTDIIELALIASHIFEKEVPKYVKKHFGFELSVPIECDFEFGFKGNEMLEWGGSKQELEELQSEIIRLGRQGGRI